MHNGTPADPSGRGSGAFTIFSRGIACAAALLLVPAAAVPPVAGAPFTPGNIVLCRVPGVAGAQQITLLEYTTAGGFVQSIALPVSGNAYGLTNGSSFLVGQINFSDCSDQVIYVATSFTTTPGPTIVPGFIRYNAATNTVEAAVVNSQGTNEARGVVPLVGTVFSASGNLSGGVDRVTGVQAVEMLDGNARWVEAFGGQVYVSSASTATAFAAGQGVYLFDPLAAPPLIPTKLTSGTFPLGFAVADADTIYVCELGNAPIGTRGLHKFRNVGGIWTDFGRPASPPNTDQANDVAAVVSGGNATLYAIAGGTAQGGTFVIRVDDVLSSNAAAWQALTATVLLSGSSGLRSIAIVPAAPPSPPSRLYVDASATGANDGSSWTDAYVELRTALDRAACIGLAVSEIWVANGRYLPAMVGSQDRTATFTLRNGLAVLGGFAGGEVSLSQRDPAVNVCILDGDLMGDDGPNFANRADNARHVVTATGTDQTAILDGFTITGGNADGVAPAPSSRGAGLYVDTAGPTIRRCVFIANRSAGDGGAVYSDIAASNLRMASCAFLGNEAALSGGGFSGRGSLVNCIFSGNMTTVDQSAGGGSFTAGTISHCTYSRNAAVGPASAAGGAGGGTTVFSNCIFRGNTAASFPQIVTGASVSYCSVEGGYAGAGNISTDPLLADADGLDNLPGTADDDLRLLAGSPCIDAASNALVPSDVTDLDIDGNTAEATPLDYGGAPRQTDDPQTTDTGAGTPPIADMGAHERFPDCNNNGIADSVDIANNPSLDTSPADGIIDSCCFCAAAGEWSNASTWGCGSSPNNGSPQPTSRYNVELACPTPNVTLDLSVTIDSVRVENGQSLAVSGGNLAIDSAAGINNDGTLTVADGRRIIALTATTLDGAAPVDLAGPTASLSSAGPTTALTNNGMVRGQGLIDARFINNGTVLGNLDGLSVRFADPLAAKVNNGLLEASLGGAIVIDGLPVTGSGAYRAADAGLIRLTPGTSPASISGATLEARNSGLVVLQGTSSVALSGAITLTSGGILQGTFSPSGTISAGSLAITTGSPGGQMLLSNTMEATIAGRIDVIGCGGAPFRGCIPPVLSLSDGSTLQGGAGMRFSGAVSVVVGSSAVVEIAGDFDNEATDAVLFDWDQGKIALSGTGRTFELAGVNLGARNPQGFVNNFAMGTVELAAGASRTFTDTFDNAAGAGCEALYVGNLVLNTGSTLTVDGCRVYYAARSGPGAVVIANDGALMSTSAGDLDGDSDADPADAAIEVNVLLGLDTNPAHVAAADLNGDGAVTSKDVRFMIELLTLP